MERSGYPRYQIIKDRDEKFYFRLRAGNGEIILKSKPFAARKEAEKGVELARAQASSSERFERKTGENGRFFFNLLAEDNEVIGTSIVYSTEQSRDMGMGIVKRDAPDSPLEDLS